MPQEAREAELARARASYAARDADARGGWEWSPLNPAAVAVRQQRELAFLRLFGARGIADPAALRVADFGCGGGQFLRWLEELGAEESRLFGVDLSEPRIALARERQPRATLVTGSADSTGLPDASCDLVAQLTLLSSVHDSALRSAIAAEMDRVLAPGGHVLWFDVRPPTVSVRAFILLRRLGWWLLRGVWRRAPFPRDDGALVYLGRAEVADLFPGYRVDGGPACVSREVVRVRGRGTALLAALADLLPPLRADLALLLTKPGGER
ncbi:MAG TPA: class I SAM-dependent methyltransferase [Coriobacteriia bacterium]